MTLTKPYEATFYIGNDSKKTFSFLFDEVSENFIKVIVKRIDGTIYTPTFSVDMELKEVVFGEDEITPTADDIICIYRDTPTIQDTQFNTLQGYNAKALENILSKIVAMIQEMKASGFSTQILQGEPWGLDLIKPADDGASVQIDYQARVLKKGLYFRMSDGNLQASANGVDFVQMPKSAEVKEFRHRLDADGNVHFEYRVDKDWIAVSTGADVSGIKNQVDKNTTDIITINGKLSAVDTQIDANADAILKTREDYIAADSEIHQILNAHASELTTHRNDIDGLGDQVSAIEEKIPETTSADNTLVNNQQLLDTEMDIRDDMDTADSELQTQITAQAAAITTLDSEKLDKNQGSINAGKVLTVGEDGIVVPSAGGTGGGLTAVSHDSSLTGAGTDESPLGIASTVLAEIADKAEQTTVETLSGVVSQNTTNIGTLRTDVDDLGDQVSGIEGKIPESTSTTNQLVNATQLSEAIAEFEALPDQTDNAGKFLKTDGTTASWEDVPPSVTITLKEYDE